MIIKKHGHDDNDDHQVDDDDDEKEEEEPAMTSVLITQRLPSLSFKDKRK